MWAVPRVQQRGRQADGGRAWPSMLTSPGSWGRETSRSWHFASLPCGPFPNCFSFGWSICLMDLEVTNPRVESI